MKWYDRVLIFYLRFFTWLFIYLVLAILFAYLMGWTWEQ